MGPSLVNNPSQQLGVKDRGGFRQRSQGGARAPQGTLDLAQFRGVLEPAEAGNNGIEKVQQHSRRVLIRVEETFLTLIALTPVPMQPLKEGEDGLQVLEALKIVFVNRWCIHAVQTRLPPQGDATLPPRIRRTFRPL